MSEHWTVEELREYQRTGREPVRKASPTCCQPGRSRNIPWDDPLPVSQEALDIINAHKNPIPQEEIERRYAEAEARGEVYALDITENPDGSVSMRPAGRVTVEITDKVPPIPEKKKRRKYGNEPTYIGWKKFDSRKEARFYEELMLRKRAGELKCVLRQVAFDLADKEKLQYVADFVAIRPDNTIEAVYDVKSPATRESDKYKIKKKLMRELWDIDIQEV